MQQKVNELSRALRLQVIEALVKEDCVKYRAALPNDAEMAYYIEFIDRLPCCTRKLADLFRDAHAYHDDIGMMPHAVTLADLEWCIKNRVIGYASMQNVKYAWLPAPADTMLRRLPAFCAIDALYKAEKKVVAPKAIQMENEVFDAVKMVAGGFKC